MSSAKTVQEYLEAELESHACSICYELMEPPERSPILLFPCGHSLCKQCLAHHLSATRKKTCALCRAPIQSHAVNISLQQLIQSMQAKRQALQQQQKQRANAVTGGQEGGGVDLETAVDDTDASKYVQMYNQTSMRCAVLATRLMDLGTATDEVDEALQASELVVQHMEQEEVTVRQRLAAAQAELQLVQQHLASQRDRQAELRDQRTRQIEQQEHVRKLLEPLERDRDKAELIVRRLAPEVKLERPIVQAIRRDHQAIGANERIGHSALPAARPVDYQAMAAAEQAVSSTEAKASGTAAAANPSTAPAGRPTSSAPFMPSAYPWTFPARPGQ